MALDDAGYDVGEIGARLHRTTSNRGLLLIDIYTVCLAFQSLMSFLSQAIWLTSVCHRDSTTCTIRASHQLNFYSLRCEVLDEDNYMRDLIGKVDEKC